MKGSLSKRLQAIESQVSPVVTGRPTAPELWRWRLVDTVAGNLRYPNRGNGWPEGKHNPFLLYAHQDTLKTDSDVRAASDDTLLEALGLPNVKDWGWLRFMVQDFGWFNLLAHNWNLPHVHSVFADDGVPDVSERRAVAARYFCELMRARGVEPMERLRAIAAGFEKAAGTTDEQFMEILRQRYGWGYFVYTCETATVRPEAWCPEHDPGKCLYAPDAAAEYLAQIRAAQVSI